LASIEAKKASYDKTIAELEAAVKAHPDDEVGAGAAYQIGVAKLFWGKRAEAMAAFQAVVGRFDPTDPALRARLAIGGMREKSGEYREAETLYSEAISRAPDSPYAAGAVGRIKAVRLAQGDAAGAGARMSAIITAHPNTEASAMAEYCQGELLLYQGKLYEGEGALGAVARKYPNRIAGGTAGVQVAAALMSDAHTMAFQRDFKKAIDNYTRVIQSAPNTSYAREALVFRARNYAWARDEERAQQDCETILRDYPDSPQVLPALFYLSQRIEARGQPQDAIAFLESHAASGPPIKQASAVLALQAFCLKSGLAEKGGAAQSRLRGEFPASREVEDLERQLEDVAGYHVWFSPRSQKKAYAGAAMIAESGLALNLGRHSLSRLMLDIGYDRCQAGDHALALQWYDRIRQEDPAWDDTVTVLARSAECKAHLGDFKAAVALFENAIAIQPLPREKGRMLLRAAQFCREGPLYDKGIKLLAKFRAEVPLDKFPELGPPAQLTLAFLWGDKGELARAAAEFQRLLDSYPNADKERPMALLQKGFCLQAMGDASGAVSCYQQLLAAYPKDPARAEARRRLAAMGVGQ